MIARRLMPHPDSTSLPGAVLVLALVLITAVEAATTPETTVGESERKLQPQLAAGDHVFELQHDGLQRRYIVHVPPRAAGRQLPVMLALHGGGGSGEFQRENRLDPVADREGFLAVYPDGTGPLSGRLLTWNSGINCCGWARKHAVDDSGFLVAVFDDLGRRALIDPRRFYVTGHSNGAWRPSLINFLSRPHDSPGTTPPSADKR